MADSPGSFNARDDNGNPYQILVQADQTLNLADGRNVKRLSKGLYEVYGQNAFPPIVLRSDEPRAV
jgi:hypothetical protein